MSELPDILESSPRIVERALVSVLEAARTTVEREREAEADLADAIQHLRIVSALRGRASVWRAVDRFRLGRFAASDAFSVPFLEAIENILTREPRVVPEGVVDRMGWVSALYSRDHAFAAARSLTEHLTQQVQAAVERLISGGLPPATTEREIYEMGKRDSYKWTRGYSAVVYRTNVSGAYSEARMEQAKDPAVREVIGALRFVAVRDERTRPNHAAADGTIAAADDLVWNRIRPPLGFQCFVPGTIIEGMVRGGLKAFYSGPVLEIETSRGHRLTVTINHPVLTSRGWLPADRLREGDYCFASSGEIAPFAHGFRNRPFPFVRMGRRAVNDENMPARIEDVFEALRIGRGRSFHARFPVLPLDLHGDAAWTDGDIDIVGANGEFLLNSTQLDIQSEEDFIHKLPARRSAFTAHGQSYGDVGFNLSWLAPRSLPSTGTLTLDDEPVIAAQFAGLPLDVLRFGASACLDVVADEKRRYGISPDAHFIAKLLDAGSGLIAPDKIIRITRSPYTGHVFDLQTETGWILSQGIVTSNCRCGLEFVPVFDLESGEQKLGYSARIAEAGPDKGFKSEV